MTLRRAMIICALLLLLVGGSVLAHDEEATPEVTPDATVEAAQATPEPTPEATAEMQPSLSEIFASLPQTRLEDGAFVVGDPDAPITIIEFADFACPHCQNYRPVIEQVIRDYVATGRAKFELRLFPTAGGLLTYRVGQLIECAEILREGTFWQTYELLYDYAEVGSYRSDIGRLLAREFDLNYDSLIDCADETAEQIDKDIAYGALHDVTGTPAILVREGDDTAHFITAGGREYRSGGVPLEVLAEVIENANGGAQQII